MLARRKDTHLFYSINQYSIPRYEVAESDTCVKFWLQRNKRSSATKFSCSQKGAPGSLADQLWCLDSRHSSQFQTIHKPMCWY